MPITIETRREKRRGCSYRKPGGLYLMAPAEGHTCCKLPHELTVCPCCGAGFKFSRGWTWVDPGKIFDAKPCVVPGLSLSADLSIFPKNCPLSDPEKMGLAGLIWIGKAHYKTTDDFQAEANRMGISRRITAVPRSFKLGETWVLLAHIKGIRVEEGTEGEGLLPEVRKFTWKPAIFTLFKPTAIEYVITGEESEGELGRLVDRGITPVRVVNPDCQRRFPSTPMLGDE